MSKLSLDNHDTVVVDEIFYSIQGESTLVGLPTVFIRLTGCPLRCTYCDTSYAFRGGNKMSIDCIYDAIQKYDCERITITGGEPLAQPNSILLMNFFVERKYRLSLETSGALDIVSVPDDVCIIMDIKTPSSGEVQKNYWSNLEHLKTTDEIKFVIGDRSDYVWVKEIMHTHKLTYQVATILFSSVHEKLSSQMLAEWILQDSLPVRLQLQMHKYIWPDSGRGV